MSISIMSYCFRLQLGDNHCAKMVLIKLADHASDDGVCWPSWSYLEKHTGYSRRSIAYAIKYLKDKKFIRIEHREGTSNMYHINLDAIIKATPNDLKTHTSKGYAAVKEITDEECNDGTGAMTAPPSATTAPPSAMDAPPPCNDCTQIINEPSVNHQSTISTKSKSLVTKEELQNKLRVVYSAWSQAGGGDPDKLMFAKHVMPLFDRYDEIILAASAKKYISLQDNPKFISLKRFAETAGAYVKSIREGTRPIDPHSDMPPEEQIKQK